MKRIREPTMIPFAHVLYALALLLVYAWMFAVPGIAFGGIVLAFWGFVFYSTNRPSAFLPAFVVALLLAVTLSSLMPVVATRGPLVRSYECKNNLKQIGIALHNYHDVYDSFPPAYVADENGKPIYSWRVLLLPFVDRDPLYQTYDLSQPWDSPENLALLKEMPPVYTCPARESYYDKSGNTYYRAILGQGTAWPGQSSSKISDFKDGAEVTIMVIEADAGIPWTAPQDFTPEEAAMSLASTDFESAGHRGSDYFHEYFYGKSVLFMDGVVKFAPFGLDQDFARELFTLDDGKPERPFDQSLPGSISQVKTKWGNVILCAAFIILTVLPLPWVWINPKGKTRNHDELPQDETQPN